MGRGKAALTDDFKSVSDQLEAQQHPKPPRPRWTFVVFILALSALLATLGVWQMLRLEQKLTQIGRIEDRLVQPPRDFPPTSEWVGFDAEVWDYRRTEVTGTFRHDQTILVFTNLSEPNGAASGPGYWVMAPLVREDGGVIWVNRGFVPQDLRNVFADGGPERSGPVTISGIMRRPELQNAFTPGTEGDNRIDWIRDPERFAEITDPALTPVLPAYLDADAGPAGTLPQGGETRVNLPNKHLEYAITWFSLSAISLIMLVYWLVRHREPPRLAPGRGRE